MNSAHKAVVQFCPLLARPARKQSSEFGGKVDQPTGSVFNIWYSKWAGGDRFNNNALEKAEHRCSINNDCGYTRATKSSSFCIHFARGVCAKGPDCNFWHRIPIAMDRVPMAQDVFGRDRHRDERDDMGGVGSFEKDNRTLYVGQLGLEGGLEDTLYRHFIEWGEIEYLRLLKGKGVAFIRFKSRVSAEFAKEAMHCQSLDNNEILNVRWATEDPNPKAALINKKKAEEKVVDALKASLPIIGEHGTILDYQTLALGASAPLNPADTSSGGATLQISDGSDLPQPVPQSESEASQQQIGWDTPNGFFYASNETAALVAAPDGAQEQAEKAKTRVDNSFYAAEGALSGQSSAAMLEGKGGPEKTQNWDGAKYVLGVGNSRVYTGEGMRHAETREKIVEAAVNGMISEAGIGVGGVSQGGAGAGGVAGMGGVAKGGFWPMLPQQQVAMKKPRVANVFSTSASGSAVVGNGVTEAQFPQSNTKSFGAKGIVSGSTMQYLAELNNRKRAAADTANTAVKRKAGGGGGGGLLGMDYGSDSD
ncbi:Pre-mRNA-splicing factor [Chytriomyces hyalinus]|nr:Pre-mRNA-splicing factor [Chytriomyces hyalinus]